MALKPHIPVRVDYLRMAIVALEHRAKEVAMEFIEDDLKPIDPKDTAEYEAARAIENAISINEFDFTSA